MRFNQLPPAALDPIMLANAEWPEFKRARSDAINTTIGVLIDPEGDTPWRPRSVIEAQRVAEQHVSLEHRYGYQTPRGNELFLSRADTFFLNQETSDVHSYQTLGGTGALNLAKDTLKALMKPEGNGKRHLTYDAGWPNHVPIFQDDFRMATYAHADYETGTYKHSLALETIDDALEGSVILLQVCGYNEDGLNRTQEQWDEVLDLAAANELVVILDAAYVGLVDGVREDTYPIQKAIQNGLFTFICTSMSKNMGLYNERLGALFIVNSAGHLGSEQSRNLDQAVRKIVRKTVSSTPLLAAETAATAFGDTDNNIVISKQYGADLGHARERLAATREIWVEVTDNQFPIVANGGGLFTKILANGFTEKQQESLKKDGILALPNSRINLGGLRMNQVGRVASAVMKAVTL
jgi:aspartate/tyrosine/aromatic aminotransferase